MNLHIVIFCKIVFLQYLCFFWSKRSCYTLRRVEITGEDSDVIIAEVIICCFFIDTCLSGKQKHSKRIFKVPIRDERTLCYLLQTYFAIWTDKSALCLLAGPRGEGLKHSSGHRVKNKHVAESSRMDSLHSNILQNAARLMHKEALDIIITKEMFHSEQNNTTVT